MTYRGRVQNGVVVLDEPLKLPDGTRVRIETEEHSEVQTLREGLLKFAGTVTGLPKDFALNHDHYLHGAPKK